MRSFAFQTACLSIAFIGIVTTPALAETLSQPTTVVELFTSQGCSSCPKTNAFVVRLNDEDPDVLALSYGVTYWDYLGWTDTFGNPASMTRQRQYDAALDSGVYTPMLVVGGQMHAPRLTKSDLEKTSVPASLALVRHSGELCIEGKMSAGAKLALIDYESGTQTVAVKRGENKGRSLTLANVVKDVTYRDWTGQMICGLHPKSALAVLAHDATTTAIIGAARFEP
ncbi:hypothetical protein GCM10009069_22920 [Algimonas arctica]|uniref:DUF1223 domain-containing protein n=1 Tax=Algimonas arctica TaxID=1479486 RepID=A0A8J3G343_9PROT|nr:DUF1223 domain-containing protein [Algimonas arctica]GHA99548.1 hypothetical protein GCM10009069_22920 [Algimonas arctica]